MNDITVKRPLTWVSEGATDVGTVRPLNEDSFVMQPDIGLWTVADGMGGHDGGSVASKMIVDRLQLLNRKEHLDDFVTLIEDTIIDVNNSLLSYSRAELDGRTIGSTFISLLIKGNVGVCLWAGDSRLYRYRRNNLEQLSEDHSYVAELIRKGMITAEDAETHPERNVITRAVGTSENLDIDITVFAVNCGDQFLLCSDGLYNAINETEMINCMKNKDLECAVKQLINTSLANQASDNISVILVKGMYQSAV